LNRKAVRPLDSGCRPVELASGTKRAINRRCAARKFVWYRFATRLCYARVVGDHVFVSEMSAITRNDSNLGNRL